MRLGGSRNSNSKNSAQGEVGRNQSGLHELETKVIRQVRAAAHHIASTFHHDSDVEEGSSRKVLQGIVSINGQDVETMRCTGRVKR